MSVVVGAVAFVVAAGAGAVVRALAGQLDGRWPVGTLAANAAGSFVLGWLVGVEVAPEVATVVGTGGLGALTTWSAVAVGPVTGPNGVGRGTARSALVLTASVSVPLAAAAVGLAVA